LDVVTSDGEFRSCSQTRHAELFDAVRGTQGQHGIITRASVALTPAPSAARSYQLRYHDLGTFLGDQGRLVHDRRFDHVLGRADYGEGAGWHFVLEALATFSPPEEPDDRLLLDGLGHARGTEQIDASSYLDFLYRLDPVEALLRSAGSWQNQPHPRCNVLLPGRHAETVISDVLDSLTPDDIGVGGSVLIYSIPTARLAAPHMPKARDALTVVFGLQRTAPLDDPQTLNRMRRANAELHARAGRLGGASYAYGPTHTSVRAPA
ncbi:MAG: FAD-linked oxidase, partial [Jatrophihabitantaceae bacterium]